ncbi:hypothetical protein NQ314_010039 [Rhamnusium bicolor]|uniref:Ankyrin repeat protein n=1 Tax=Rhamnusium bicolor TaxID=1586634 RepID=A0AAV8XUM5_9CUCU|nr:hypothetical protein NQ314_010039 [Rhamnusium bicolor]
MRRYGNINIEKSHIESQIKFNGAPLTIAAFNGFSEVAELLLSKGVNIEHSNKNGDMALTLASYK